MNLDAYTVRKVAPRLLIAAIGINLSIYLCVAAIDITNIVGHSLANLIFAPFDKAGELNFTLDEGGGNIAGFLVIATILPALVLTGIALSGGALGMIFFSLLPIFLIVLAILITIVIRTALLVLLTIISPVAIALWVLPGTEKYFKQWWDLFLKTLLVYPIVAALFAISNVLSIIAFGNAGLQSEGDISNLESAANIITGIVLGFMPLVLIPFAFKFAGGAIGAVAGAAMNSTQGIRRLSGKQRQGILARNLERNKGGNLFKTNKESGFRHRVNKIAQGGHLLLAEPDVGRKNLRTAMTDHRTAYGAKAAESDTLKNAGFNDPLFRAMLEADDQQGIEDHLAKHEPGMYAGAHNADRRRQAAERAMSLKNQYGEKAANIAAFRALAPNSTAWEDFEHMSRHVKKVAGGDDALELQLLAEGMQGQARAGRVDIGGGSTSAAVGYMGNLRELNANKGTAREGWVSTYDSDGNHTGHRRLNEEEASQEYEQSVLERNSAYALLQGKPKSAARIAQSYRRRVEAVSESLRTGKKIRFYDAETEKSYARAATKNDMDALVKDGLKASYHADNYASTEGGTAWKQVLGNTNIDTGSGVESIESYAAKNNINPTGTTDDASHTAAEAAAKAAEEAPK